MGLWNGEEPATSGGAEPEHDAEGPVRSAGGPPPGADAPRADGAPATGADRQQHPDGPTGTERPGDGQPDHPPGDARGGAGSARDTGAALPHARGPADPPPRGAAPPHGPASHGASAADTGGRLAGAAPLPGAYHPASPPPPAAPPPAGAPVAGAAQWGPGGDRWAAPAGQPAPWQPPSVIEQELYEAKSRGDWAGYFDVLARTPLFVADSRARVDAHPDTVVFTPYRDPRTRTDCLAVYTEGMLPAPVEDPVFHSGSLGWYARVWGAKDPPWLAVNPGSPCEAYFPTTAGHRAIWQRHAEEAERAGRDRGHPSPQLRALFIGGPLRGPVAHGLACGALLSVNNGELWNAMAYHGGGYTAERDRLEEWWGITSRQEWQRTQELLLRAEMTSPVWEFTLSLRRSLALDFAGAVAVDHWRQVAERALWHNAAEAAEPRITPDGVTMAQPRSDAEVRSQVAGVRRLIGRITRYEARFRADGLLAEGKFVRSVEAWDYGRASCMARWGLGARYCTLEEAEQAVLRAGRLSQANYRSWEDFSAAYILGRCLHFDEEEFGEWYEDMVAAHRLLMSDPGSPWRNLPWK